MRRTVLMCLASAVVMVVAFTALSQTETEVLGNIEFPTSGSPEAQKHFLRGVKLLHSFAFEAAAEALAGGLGPSLALSARNRSTGRSEASGRSARPRNSHGSRPRTTHSPRSAVELRLGEKRRRLAKDLVRPLELTVLSLKLLQPLTLVRRQSRSFPSITLCSTHPRA